ncbi:hypothetical protein [Deinococcus sp. Arct2-2]|uniref:hypothetical protein n=1 Tax=Deinococcus sp. Arct2-2 TaxID=2568653 RepID=UPI001454C765|nr:hypothetical protein [Deinococcus sp. Arct2-2]
MRAAVHLPRLHPVRWGQAAPGPATLVLHAAPLTSPLHAVLSTQPDLLGAVWSVALSQSQQASAHRLPAAVRELLNQEGVSGVQLLLLEVEPAAQTALAALFSAEVYQFVALSLPAAGRGQTSPIRALRKLLYEYVAAPPPSRLLSPPSPSTQRGAA